MGMTIWVNYLKDGKVTSDESDKSAMYRHLNKLDGVCGKLHVRKISDFLDTTDLEAAYDGRATGAVNGWDLMVKEGSWFRPHEGVAVLSALIAHLREKPIRFGMLSNDYVNVMADLRECLASVEQADDQGAGFHLCVVA